MKSLKVWYKKPRKVHREITTMTTPETQRKITTIVEDKLLDESLAIPCCPYIHNAGLQAIIKLCNKNSSTIATLLLTCLHSSKQNNIVEISIAELCNASNLSKPTVIAALDSLCEYHFITRAGQQKYKIEPTLAWYGNQVDWAIALKEHKTLYGFNFEYSESYLYNTPYDVAMTTSLHELTTSYQ